MGADGTQAERGAAFRALHEGPAFVIPNPWDAGSARVLAALGFRALATTSSGFAFTLGRPDGGASLDEVVAHVRALCAASTLPVSVDLESGHGDPARAVAAVAGVGAVGGSIEDWVGGRGLLPLEEAAERVAAAVSAARGLGFPFVVTGRAENHIHGNPDLDDTIARLQAYERAGADVLYAPGLATLEEVRAVCDAVSRPVNVLARPDFTLAGLAAVGVVRVSVGGLLAWSAVHAFAEAAERAREGDFSGLRARGRIGDWIT